MFDFIKLSPQEEYYKYTVTINDDGVHIVLIVPYYILFDSVRYVL